MRGIFFLFSLIIGTSGLAAPIPATSSSEFLGSDIGLYRSPEGFAIDAGSTSWSHLEPPKDTPHIATLYHAPYTTKGVQGALTVRVDKIQDGSALSTYMSKWIRDYPRFGFDILSTKKIKISGQVGFLLDMLNRENERQLRQVVFVKEKTAVILTCRDHKEGFLKTLNACNQIIRNFHWL